MERIVIEVDDQVAQAWRKASSEKRNELVNKINARIGKELLKDSKEDFAQYLNQLRDTLAERGLTQEALDDILNEPY